MKKKISTIIFSAITAAAIATAFVIIHKPIPKPQPIEKPRIYLNDTLSNAMSEIPELEGLDKKVKKYISNLVELLWLNVAHLSHKLLM
jgi:hypothetical protein